MRERALKRRESTSVEDGCEASVIYVSDSSREVSPFFWSGTPRKRASEGSNDLETFTKALKVSGEAHLKLKSERLAFEREMFENGKKRTEEKPS